MTERLTITLKVIPGRTCKVGDTLRFFCRILDPTSDNEFIAAAAAWADAEGVFSVPWFCGCDCCAATPSIDTNRAEPHVLKKWLFT